MKISPKYTNEEWKSLVFDKEKDWLQGIDIFNDRIKGRFMVPISKMAKYEYAGFAIMALDCLLIETLQQFIEGKPSTPRYKVKDYFIKFLVKQFGEPFDVDMALMFYDHIRNGILHSAEIKKDSLIRIDSDLPIAKYTEHKTGLVINRDKFHSRLKQVIQQYVNELKDNSNIELRSNFRKKMDYIARVGISES